MSQAIRSLLGNVELDIDCAARICWALLKGNEKKRGHFKPLFAAFPEISAEDVHQEMLMAICRQWPGYDPGKSASTFFQQRGNSAMLDLHRRQKSAKSKVERAADQMREEDFQHEDHPALVPDDQPPAKALAANLVLARKIFARRRFRRGQRVYTMPQRIAIAMLMRQRMIGAKRCRRLLLGDTEAQNSIGLKSVPSRRSLLRAAAALRDFESQNDARGSKRGGQHPATLTPQSSGIFSPPASSKIAGANVERC